MTRLEEFRDIVDSLFSMWKDFTLEERILIADRMCEEYYEEFGKYPEVIYLNKFADFILADSLSDKHPDKMSKTEYPFMSVYQEHRRTSKQLIMPHSDIFDYLDQVYNKAGGETSNRLSKTSNTQREYGGQ